VFGQGTFDDAIESESQDKIYQATKQGSKWSIRQLLPQGQVPSRRFGACAAHVTIEGTSVDGLMVLGGQEGGTVDTTSYKEVWWLDFSASPSGRWENITSRFANMDAIGFRREGACAFDQATNTFYSWMGRASSGIPEGASRSSGVWRADLSPLAVTDAPLQWERLAADNLAGLKGRRLIPSIWDPVNRRMFAMGGRNDLAEYSDVWAIYPDVTGPACEALDWSSSAPTPTATPSRTPDPNQATPTPTSTSPTGTQEPLPTVTPVPTSDQPGEPQLCEFIVGRVPQAAVNFALSNPAAIGGWGDLCYPNRPAGPFNGFREYLSLRNLGAAYHPLYNNIVYGCGCP
jgi:hypothetical protein